MANKESSRAPGTPRRRRPAATIDLPAADISAQTASEPAATDADITSMRSEPQPTSEMPGAETRSAATDASAAPSPPEEKISSSKLAPAPVPASERPWQMLAAAMAGAIVVLVAVVTLPRFGIMQGRDADTADMAVRLARMESLAATRTGTAETRPADDVAARLAKVEAALTAQPAGDPGVGARVGALETTIKAVGDAATALNSRTDDTAVALRELRSHIDTVEKAISELRMLVERQRDATSDKSELERLSGRIAALESATRTVQREIDPRDGTTADRSVRVTLVASALREKVSRGAPFAAELAALKSFGEDAAALQPLEPFAASGLASADALCGELTALLPKLKAPGETAQRPGTLLERLQVNASQLVRIRPLGEAAGDDSVAILGRVEFKAAHRDLDGALAELLRLPPATRAPAGAWIAKVQARQAAVAAAQQVAAQSMGALAPTAQRP